MTDALVVGAGLSGLVAAAELTAAGRRVIVLDQEPRQSLGGQGLSVGVACTARLHGRAARPGRGDH